MKISIEKYKRLIQFLDMEMNGEEMEAFQRELEEDPELYDQLTFEISLRNQLATPNRLNKLEYTDAAGQAKQNENAKATTPSIRMTRWIVYTAAACLLLTILISRFAETDTPVSSPVTDIPKKDTLLITDNEEDKPLPQKITISDSLATKLFAKHFKIEKIPEKFPPELSESLIAYENGNYNQIEQANIELLAGSRSVNDKQQVLELGHFYKGIALLKRGNLPQAIKNLQGHKGLPSDPLLAARSRWYLSLAYLKSGEIKNATSLLEKIIETGNAPETIKDARGLLKELTRK